jgi:hypothetical protein|tara:strand:- start:1368 stop:1877 length:510 start_codon:yes stop_codon:yes gene_type:complete
MGIIGKIAPLALLSIGILFLGNALVRPAQASATAQALTSSGVGLGASLGSIGSGIQSLFTGVGTGAAKLLNPLFTIKDLIGYTGSGTPAQSGFVSETGLSGEGTPLTASPVVRNFVETIDPSYVLNTNATYSFIEANYSPTDQIAIKRAIESSRAQFPQYFSGGTRSDA